MIGILIATLKALLEKYADAALDEGFKLLERLLSGEATDADVLEYLRRRQEGEFDA